MRNTIKKALCICLINGFAISSAFGASNYTAVDEFSKDKFSVNTEKYLKDSKLNQKNIDFDDKKLLKVLINTKEYFAKHSDEDPVVKREGFLSASGVSLKDVLNTLDYMINILNEDIADNKPTRLKNPDFINKNFKVIRWLPYNPKDLSQTEKIRITKYAVFTHQGSKVKTDKFNTPLYALKNASDTDLFYKKYTKQDILSGIYEKDGKEYGKVLPLVYLTREGLEEALMEGTILINLPDGGSELFNVDKNNSIAYVKGLNPREQKRYWYFKKTESINGYGKKFEDRIKVEPGVTFAGDVFNVGVGRVVALEYDSGNTKKIRLGIIADTGGAFLPNLHQLDFLAGIYKTREDFVKDGKNLPPYVNVYFLIKK